MSKKKSANSTRISYNFLVLGDQMVGKTSITERYISDRFRANYLTTIGMDRKYKRLVINNTDVDVFITDTAGEERFRSLAKSFYKNTDGILVGFSLIDKKSFNSIEFWLEQINDNCNDPIKTSLVLFGNKCDDKLNIVVKPEEINVIKEKHNLEYFKTSAKENINVQNLFEYLIKNTIIKKGDLEKIGLNKNSTINDIIIKIKENQKLEPAKRVRHKKKKCC